MDTPDTDQQQQLATRRLSATLARVLGVVPRFRPQGHRLLRERGHGDISLSHQVVFHQHRTGPDPGDRTLAERAQITQQAMGKTLRELESLGYIEQAVDATDRRARPFD